MTLPVWLVIVLVILALVTIVDRMLVPSIRWYFQRRVNKIIDEINTRLDISIKPFQLTKRHVLIDRLVHDPKVQHAIAAYAQDNKIPRDVAQEQVVRYSKEIVPSFNAYVYFRFGYWLAKRIARLLYRIRVSFSGTDRLAQIDPNATVVFVINHRSNMDYVLVAFLAAEKTALSYAVGEWARVWPLQTLIRAMGAFFVRRNSGNALYRRVLERYIAMATEEGVCQAVFLEGGLSRDGKMRSPKLGFLDYMLRNHDCGKHRDLVFVPVGLNYDRTLEDRTLLHSLQPEPDKKSFAFILKTALGFLLQNIKLMALSRWRRFGYACVHFGSPLSMRAYCAKKSIAFNTLDTAHRFTEVESLAGALRGQIAACIPVLPVPVVAYVMLHSSEPLSTLEWLAKCHQLLERLQAKGAVIAFPPRTRSFALEYALEMLQIRRLIEDQEGKFVITPGNDTVLRYYANSIEHWLEDSST